MVGPEKAERLKLAAPAGTELKFVSRESDASLYQQLVPRARALVIDASHCRKGGPGVELVRLCAVASVPIIPFFSLTDSIVADVSTALHAMPVDILFDPADDVARVARALGICTERRWPMLLAANLELELSRLPRELALVSFATICGALAPETVAEFHRMAGPSPSTNTRSLASAGLGPPRRLLVGARVARALDAMRNGSSLPPVAREFGFGTLRSARRALRQAAGTSMNDLRSEDPKEVVLRVADWMRSSQWLATKRSCA